MPADREIDQGSFKTTQLLPTSLPHRWQEVPAGMVARWMGHQPRKTGRIRKGKASAPRRCAPEPMGLCSRQMDDL